MKLGALLVAGGTAALAFLLVACERAPVSEKLFEDVTAASGLDRYTGITYGAAWGDFDGDGRPDLYVTNHLNPAKLFRNEGGGRFADVTGQWFSDRDTGGDKHGAAWADFDNDGRLDLVQLRGAERGVGSEAKSLFANRGHRFLDIGEAAGIANPLSRTRMPLWFDADGNGLLDLFEGAEARFDKRELPFIFLQQRAGKFEPAPQAAHFASQSAPFCVLTALSAAEQHVVCRVPQKGATAQIFALGHVPMEELRLLPVTAFEDVAAGDFDNDGMIDLFLARKNPAPPVAIALPAANELIADMLAEHNDTGNPVGFSFRTSGELTVRVPPMPGGSLSPQSIFIGAQGTHPAGVEFKVSAASAKGAPKPAAGRAAPGLRIGADGDLWRVELAPSSDAGAHQVAVKIISSAPISEAAADERKAAEEAPARLFMNRGGKLVEESEKRGVNTRLVSAVNVVAGDFNNDMYLDLFVVASGDIGKQENLLLLNRGDGHFDMVKDAGGAAGGTLGVGDSVTTVDFDGDGFLDLLVATGGSMGRSLGPASEAGGYRLYRNVAKNGNHWLEIDLEGTRSNRNGIGARVELTAGGVKQVRVQDGGVHHRGQNHMRLHFGLARHTQADTITVRWPSGAVQTLTAVRADQVLRITER